MALYVIMMGIQGAGKGMQAGIIQEEYGIPQVSTGDLFRAMFGREDELAQKVKAILAAGDLVPDDITCEMVEERLAHPDAEGGAILDGFPRNAYQANWLKDHLAKKGEAVNAVVLLELDLYIAFKRAFGRITDKETGASHNVFFNTDGIESWDFVADANNEFPPRLDVTLKSGNPVKRRSDDADAFAIVNRIDTYMENTMPLVVYYEEQGLVERVNADQSIAAVTADLKAVIEARKAKV
jgi:adenylate kinase